MLMNFYLFFFIIINKSVNWIFFNNSWESGVIDIGNDGDDIFYYFL